MILGTFGLFFFLILTEEIKGLEGDRLDDCEWYQMEGEPCTHKLPSVQFYYNETAFKCLEFNYTGCGWADNRFESQEECSAACLVGVINEEPKEKITFKKIELAKDPPSLVGSPKKPERNQSETEKEAVWFGGGVGNCSKYSQTGLKVLRFAMEWTDSLKRFTRSGKVNGLNVELIQLKDGEIKQTELITKFKTLIKENDELVVMLLPSSDAILLGDADEILKQFKSFDSRIVCDKTSMGCIGYVKDLLKLMKNANTKFPFRDIGERFKISLDTDSKIFHVLDEKTEEGNELEVIFINGIGTLVNIQKNTRPLVLIANGEASPPYPSASLEALNFFGNYLADSWNEQLGCLACLEDNLIPKEFPTVLLAIFIPKPIPFLEEFFAKIYNLEFRKWHIHLLIYNVAKYHQSLVEDFARNYSKEYASVNIIPESPDPSLLTEQEARNLAVDYAISKDCDYLFSVDGEAHLGNPLSLKELIIQNRGVIAPLLQRPLKTWANFWGRRMTGFYARSSDYSMIVEGKRKGIWNVPHISGAYLVSKAILQNEKTRPNYSFNEEDSSLAFSLNNLLNGVFMFVSNRVEFGYLINSDNFETFHLHNELYQIIDNPFDWQERYVHPKHKEIVERKISVKELMADKEFMPCPDVFWFPVVNESFCNEIISEVENYGNWSSGKNLYEDVKLVEIGFHGQWLKFLQKLVAPLEMKAYPYQTNGDYKPTSNINLIARYKPSGETEAVHEDDSGFTSVLALSTPHKDYEGGGCHFKRYNCTVKNIPQGWIMLYPGKMTHMHQELPITKGTRYALISYNNPLSTS